MEIEFVPDERATGIPLMTTRESLIEILELNALLGIVWSECAGISAAPPRSSVIQSPTDSM